MHVIHLKVIDALPSLPPRHGKSLCISAKPPERPSSLPGPFRIGVPRVAHAARKHKELFARSPLATMNGSRSSARCDVRDGRRTSGAHTTRAAPSEPPWISSSKASFSTNCLGTLNAPPVSWTTFSSLFASRSAFLLWSRRLSGPASP